MAHLRAEHIHKRYRDHRALDDVSIQVPERSIFGLLGPNGAGKTSLIRIINQITGPDEGRVLINGRPITREDIAIIGYLPEERGLYKKMKVGEQAIYLARLKGMSKSEARKKLRIWFDRFGILEWWSKPIEDLSKGMAQKVQFITTVLHEPELLILDEPFSGFDPINAELIKSEILRLRDEGATVMLSTHNMGSVEEICDDMALINKGKVILEGKVKEVKDRFKEEVYDVFFTGEVLGFTNALWTGFELLTKETTSDKMTKARVRMLDGNHVNELMEAIMPHVKVNEVKEVIPSMNDIFIKVVTNSTQDNG
ncbi:MAG: ATP-binding cassette domain-containing protein [Bacteroidetes bacterium]|jgi:ABC-2 type transport system ATP-binding protein|nr:ATP-binding cassette domain-containing protein [Bacteroidota bacterium]MDA0974046.1 ATP-binding cassette domain-containing protein [Bacteroidota bacterium]